MRTALDCLRRLHEHRLWLRARFEKAIRPLSDAELRRAFPMGPGSVLGVLAHCWGAENIWLDSISGSAAPSTLPSADAFPSLDALLGRWKETDDRWARFFATVTEAELDRPVVRVRDGKSYTTTLADVLIHVCTHQMYHAAQLNNMLRQLGDANTAAAFVPSDFIIFGRETWRGPNP
ncbi:MAG: DinB family protein [Phycisphaerae bacterium]|nr:DinB family protein [Phycisphaerae bacterium]